MKRIQIILLFLIMLQTVSTFAQEEPEFKKYNMISGYVEYKIGGSAKGKSELFFEEYGSFNATSGEVKIDTLGRSGEYKTVEIATPDSIYSIDLLKATGTKGPAPDISKSKEIYVIEKGDFEKVKAQLMKDEGYIKVGNEKILDRDCVIWEHTEAGTTTKIWLWKGIELKTQAKSNLFELIMEAINIHEEEPIPFFRFEPPSGVKWEVTK